MLGAGQGGYIHVIPMLRKPREEQFKVNLGYIRPNIKHQDQANAPQKKKEQKVMEVPIPLKCVI